MKNLEQNIAEKDLTRDLLEIIKSSLSPMKFTELESFLLKDAPPDKIDLNQLSKTDLAQLNFNIDQSQDRFFLDRTITFSKKHLNNTDYNQLLIKLGELCITHGMYNYANELIGEIKKESESVNLKVDSLFIQANIYAKKGKWIYSLEAIKKAKELYNELNDISGLAECDNVIGSIYAERGQLGEAGKYYKESHRLAKSEKNEKLQAKLEVNLGIINSIENNFDAASIYFSDALKKFKEQNDTKRIAEVEHNIGMMHRDRRDYNTAITHIDNAIQLAMENDFHAILAISYIAKAEILINLDEMDFAFAISKKAMETAHQLNDQITIAEVYRIRGIIYRKKHKYDLAENSLQSALRINKTHDAKLNSAECNYELSQLFRVIQDKEFEKKYLSDALKDFKKLNRQNYIEEIESRLNQLKNNSA